MQQSHKHLLQEKKGPYNKNHFIISLIRKKYQSKKKKNSYMWRHEIKYIKLGVLHIRVVDFGNEHTTKPRLKTYRLTFNFEKYVQIRCGNNFVK